MVSRHISQDDGVKELLLKCANAIAIRHRASAMTIAESGYLSGYVDYVVRLSRDIVSPGKGELSVASGS